MYLYAFRLIRVGGVTFTGSIVAFLKLAGKVSSRPTILPGRHLVNSSLLGVNVATMGAFVTMAPGAPAVAAACLGANTALSFVKGYTTTAAIGGADMRTFFLFDPVLFIGSIADNTQLWSLLF